MKRSLLAAFMMTSLLAAGAAYAQEDMSTMDHATMSEDAAESPFEAVNAQMHESMNVTFTGDIDKDFVRSMIPHHEGAVAMAKIVLDKGKDPEIRALAEAVVKAQEAEIAQMKTWLDKHPD